MSEPSALESALDKTGHAEFGLRQQGSSEGDLSTERELGAARPSDSGLAENKVQAKTSAQNSEAFLPAIICLLLCQENEPTTAPELIVSATEIRLIEGDASATINFDNAGGAVQSCTVTPELPAGLSVSVSGASCLISGTPQTTQAASQFTITAVNEHGESQLQISIEISEPSSLTLTGVATFDLVPTQASPARLNYDATIQRPIREATVQLLDEDNTVLQTTRTDLNGGYQFSLDENQLVRIRVLAQLRQADDAATYDVRIVDNTRFQALYTLAEAEPRFVTDNRVRNLHAVSGWDGVAYSAIRPAAPFAMLDSIYQAVIRIIAVDDDVQLPSLRVNWSVNNVPVFGDVDQGEIGTSFYSDGQLFILGAANSDTDEYDDHVVIHEWGHYFEDQLSRSDSIGGPHTASDRLDKRVAFGEGFGNALSGIVTDDPLYIDTSGAAQARGFIIDVEDNFQQAERGWFNESTVQSLLYDFYDSQDDGADTVSLGFAPLYRVLLGAQRNTDALTSLFSFVTALRDQNPSAVPAIDALLESQQVNADNLDDFGSNATNAAGLDNDVLPIYANLEVGAEPIEVCTITTFGRANKLSNFRYFKVDIDAPGRYVINMTRTSSSYGDTDPDFRVYRQGDVSLTGFSPDTNNENRAGNLSSGIHVIEITDFMIRQGTSGRACFDVSINLDG